MSWLTTHWERFRRRRRHFKEFRETGVVDVRRQADANVFEAEKLKDARLWLHREDTRYPRFSARISAASAVISVASVLTAISALGVSYQTSRNAVRADRAWVGPASMRLSEKPVVGKPIQVFFEYQNTGRQPALDVFYLPDSFSFNRDMLADIAARQNRNAAECKSRQTTEGKLMVFPGKQTFTPYQLKKNNTLISKAMTSGSELAFVAGCFVYRTLGEVHRTAFCFQYDASNSQEDDEGRPLMSPCLEGSFAD